MDELSVGDLCYVEYPRMQVFGIPTGRVEWRGVVVSVGSRKVTVKLDGTGEIEEVERKKVKKERLFMGQPCLANGVKGVIAGFGAGNVFVRLSTGQTVFVDRTKVKMI